MYNLRHYAHLFLNLSLRHSSVVKGRAPENPLLLGAQMSLAHREALRKPEILITQGCILNGGDTNLIPAFYPES